MITNEVEKLLKNGSLSKYSDLYDDLEAQTDRFIKAIETFKQDYGDFRDIQILSVPGRSEILGNHTDHNNGVVLAGAINRDLIAVVSKNEDGKIRIHSEGYPEFEVDLNKIDDPLNFEKFTSSSLIAGMVKSFKNDGYIFGGYDAYMTSEVLKGSGLSSSAAFEVMIGSVLNYLYNDGKVDNEKIAQMAQYAENVYFDKPCGLMDQMACAVGGFVFIDFENPENPIVEPIEFSLSDKGYALCIINTGGNHADLNSDYASVPCEMKLVANAFSKPVLRGIKEMELVSKIPELRKKVGDRAILRAFHFIRENERVVRAKDALKNNDINAFFKEISESGRSSFEYLQNVYTTLNVKEQGLSLALCLADGYFAGKSAFFRVHGGGFAGTIQVFLPKDELNDFVKFIDSVLGEGSTMPLNIRPSGACRLF